jgi:putative ABC transport system ATP-binding protein
MSDAPLIEVRGLTKEFDDGRVVALSGVDLDIATGEFVAITGPSGCGKSTLLHLIAALERPTSGTIRVGGRLLSEMPNLNHYRAMQVGLVFQLDNLITTLSAGENVQVPMFEAHLSPHDREAKAHQLLQAVGLRIRDQQRPSRLSGGERQRVAIARALANDAPILLADEPTGRLDSASGQRILDLLAELRRQRNLTVIMVTHENVVAERADRIVHMLDGRVLPEVVQPTQSLR